MIRLEDARTQEKLNIHPKYCMCSCVSCEYEMVMFRQLLLIRGPTALTRACAAHGAAFLFRAVAVLLATWMYIRRGVYNGRQGAKGREWIDWLTRVICWWVSNRRRGSRGTIDIPCIHLSKPIPTVLLGPSPTSMNPPLPSILYSLDMENLTRPSAATWTGGGVATRTPVKYSPIC